MCVCVCGSDALEYGELLAFRNIWFYVFFLALILGTGIFELERPIVKPVGILEQGPVQLGMPLGLHKLRGGLLPL